MVDFRLATQNDTRVDLEALERVSDDPKAFYRLIDTITSAIVYNDAGEPLLEE